MCKGRPWVDTTLCCTRRRWGGHERHEATEMVVGRKETTTARQPYNMHFPFFSPLYTTTPSLIHLHAPPLHYPLPIIHPTATLVIVGCSRGLSVHHDALLFGRKQARHSHRGLGHKSISVFWVHNNCRWCPQRTARYGCVPSG